MDDELGFGFGTDAPAEGNPSHGDVVAGSFSSPVMAVAHFVPLAAASTAASGGAFALAAAALGGVTGAAAASGGVTGAAGALGGVTGAPKATALGVVDGAVLGVAEEEGAEDGADRALRESDRRFQRLTGAITAVVGAEGGGVPVAFDVVHIGAAKVGSDSGSGTAKLGSDSGSGAAKLGIDCGSSGAAKRGSDSGSDGVAKRGSDSGSSGALEAATTSTSMGSTK